MGKLFACRKKYCCYNQVEGEAHNLRFWGEIREGSQEDMRQSYNVERAETIPLLCYMWPFCSLKWVFLILISVVPDSLHKHENAITDRCNSYKYEVYMTNMVADEVESL